MWYGVPLGPIAANLFAVGYCLVLLESSIMAFLKRFFGGDPGRDLDRAAALLESGEPEKALELARRAGKRAAPADAERVRRLVEEARAAVASAALEKASLAEASEYFEDAAEWIEVAAEHTEDAARRSELEALRRSLLERAQAAEQETWEPPEPEPDTDTQTELDPGVHYQALIDMLVEDVAERYHARLPAFRLAYVALNEGRVAEAHEAFEALATATGEDPVLLFERGRGRLAVDRAEAAAADFEAAWPELGDRALDLAGELSVPGQWAEAMLAQDRPEPVIERLAELADPIDAAPLAEHYAQALLAAERYGEARDFLAAAITRNSARDRFAYLLAQALEQLGERAAAIDCLETAIAPSCASGCKPRPKYLPSFRALASLYLEDESRSERVRELMTQLAQAKGGRLDSRDHSLLARYYEQIGDAEAAGHARDHARRLRRDAEAPQAAEPAPAPSAGMRAPI